MWIASFKDEVEKIAKFQWEKDYADTVLKMMEAVERDKYIQKTRIDDTAVGAAIGAMAGAVITPQNVIGVTPFRRIAKYGLIGAGIGGGVTYGLSRLTGGLEYDGALANARRVHNRNQGNN